MAERRMFSKLIIDSDMFLDMPLSTQALYFHLSMRADDDGFINNPRKIQRMIGCNDDDLKVLITKQFIIPFESGVCVIKHWRIHNYIQKDRYKPTLYDNEKQLLKLEQNNSYELNNEPVSILDTQCVQDGYRMDTQDRLGKVRLGKDSIDNSISKDILVSKNLIPIVEEWNNLNLSKVKSIKGNRLKILNTRIKEYGIDNVLEAIKSINKSSFLKGQNNKNWTITFDWLIKPNNFPKVLEGNYIDKEGVNNARNITKDNETSQKPKYDFTCFE